jgi:nitrate reductase gamma subunit
MTYDDLAFTFIGSGLIALGTLALIAGFFIGLLSPKQRFEQASLIFLAGAAALAAGAWLMRAAP